MIPLDVSDAGHVPSEGLSAIFTFIYFSLVRIFYLLVPFIRGFGFRRLEICFSHKKGIKTAVLAILTLLTARLESFITAVAWAW